MQRGDIVIALHMRHLGVGVIELVEPDNRLLVCFEVDGRVYRDSFAALELELATRVPAKS